MQKYVLNGQVAVLHSNDWGTPWATWHPETMFDKQLIKLFLAWRDAEMSSLEELKLEDRAWRYLRDAHPDVSFRGFDGLTVTWLPEGQEFLIREYDGVEVVVRKGEIKWLVA